MRLRKNLTWICIPLILLLIAEFSIVNLRSPLIHPVHATPETTVSVSPSTVINDTLTPETSLTLRPDGDGDEIAWTGGYEDWDDWPTPNNDDDYVSTTLTLVYESSTLEDHTTETWSISRVKVTIVAKATHPHCQVAPIVVAPGDYPGIYEGASYNLTTTYQTYTSEWGINPATDPYTYWTWSDIDSLEAGVGSIKVPSGEEIRVTQLYVEVSGSRLTVDIHVDDVEDLWGWQFDLSYDPNVIEGVWANQYYGGKRVVLVGPFLGSAGGMVMVSAGAGWNNTVGKLSLTLANVAQTDPAYLPSGSGFIATVIFDVVGKGESEIRLDSLTGLSDTTGYIIYGRDYVEDGYFRNVDLADIPSVSFSYSADSPAPEPLEGHNVTFTASVTGGVSPYTYKWYFWKKYRHEPLPEYDRPVVTSTSSTSQNYTRRGSWNVTLTVIDDDGVVGSHTGYIRVKAHDVHIVFFSTNTTMGRYPLGVNFTEIGNTMEINVTAKNQGDFTESFNVTCFWSYYEAGGFIYGTIGTQYGITLAAGANTTLTFYWDTAGRNLTHPLTYQIHANASRVQYEYDIEWTIAKIVPNELICGDPMRVRFHDVAVTNVATNATTPITPGDVVEVTVTVKNQGDFNETDVSVTAYYDETPIDTEIIYFMTNSSYAAEELAGNDTATLEFDWDTTGIPASAYRISGRVDAVTDEYDTSDNTLTDGTVRWPGMPEAVFTYSPSEPVAGATVSFDASDTNDLEDDPLSYGWDFGDGETDSGVTVEHEYEAAGEYNVTLTVSDGINSDIEKKMLVVHPAPTHDINVVEVTASPAYPPDMIVVGDYVTINVEVMNEGNVEETFAVNVYSDSIPIEKRPNVVLSAGATETLAFIWNTIGAVPDIYTINATVPPIPEEIETGDNTASFSSVAFTGPPQAVFTYLPAEPDVSEAITFDASDSTPDGGVLTDPDSYAWDFESDGTIDTYGMVVTHNYTIAGSYTVTLNVTDSEGKSDETAQSVTVSAGPDAEDPVADAGSDQTVDVNTTVTFDAGGSTDNVGIVSYVWDFDDGTAPQTKSVPVTTHVYTEIGTYTVTLTVSDAAGNTDTDTVTVTVREAAPPLEVPIWLIIVIVVVVVAVVLAVVLLRRRGS